MSYKTSVHKGYLVIIGNWVNDWDEPTQSRMYWPTGIKAVDVPHLIGWPASYRGEGVYRVDAALITYVALADRGCTKAVFVEHRPIKRLPRSHKYYYQGSWHKETQLGGE